MLGSVTDRVIRTAPCPVLAISKLPHDSSATGEERGHVHHHLSRILFCTDFSENSERALNYAITTIAEYDAELTLLHVLKDISGASSIDEAIAMEQLDNLIPPEKPKAGRIRSRSIVRRGSAYEQIIQLALEAQTDVVIMAVRGRGALNAAVFGSTTYRVIQLGPCPVLAVHV